MADSRRESIVPWIAAGVAGAVLAGLLVVYFVVLRPDQRDADAERAAARQRVVGELSTHEQDAVHAAGTEMVNLLSFRRASFDADYQRALDGATGGLKSDVAAKKTVTKTTMTQGRFDLSGRVTNAALSDVVTSGASTGYVVLLTVEGFRSTAPNSPIQQTIAMTVLYVGGKWLAADVTNIGISS